MKLSALALVLVLALFGGGCTGPEVAAMRAIGVAFDDYRAAADPAVDRDPTLTDGRKKALKAESAEIKKTLDALKGD